MAIIDPARTLGSFSARGAVGPYERWLNGDITWEQVQELSPLYGIYQVRNYNGEKRHVLERFYRPTNPQTEPQQAWRSVFAEGVAHWHSLTPAEKESYNARAERLRLSGFCLHQREWLGGH